MSALSFIFYRLLALSALASAANVGSAQPRVSCPTRAWTYVEKTNACYKAILSRVTWESAFESCKRVNATLPVIHDANTENALLDFTRNIADVRTRPGSEDYFHIGLRRTSTSGKWQWTDGSKVDFQRWSGSGPSETSAACAYAILGEQSRTSIWEPEDCNDWENPYICVFDGSRRVSSTVGGETQAGGQQPGGQQPEEATTVGGPSTPSSPDNGSAEVNVDTGSGTPEKECKDVAPGWACSGLKKVYACKVPKFIKYPSEKCAKTCNLCK